MKFDPTTVFLVLFGVFIASCLACNMSTRFKEAMTEEEKVDAKAKAGARNIKKQAKDPEAASKYCPNSQVLKTDRAGSNCYGFCPDNAAIYKTDPEGSNCYGTCVDNINLNKIDAAGSNCYGYCPDNKNIYMTDPEGQNCYGYCRDGTAKIDRKGSNCRDTEGFEGMTSSCTSASGTVVQSEFGCCSDGTAMVDASGTNCPAPSTTDTASTSGSTSASTSASTAASTSASYTCSSTTGMGTSISPYGCCANGSAMADAAGSNCASFTCKSATGTVVSAYGCCSDGSPMTDAGGKNCAAAAVCNFGMCPNSTRPDGTSTCKTDAAGSNCYGWCNDGTTYKTDAAGSNCAANRCSFGMCPDEKTCKTDSAGSNCVSTYNSKTYTCNSVSGPIASAYGCCSDGSPMTDAGGKNCAGAVVACNYGKCTDGVTCKTDSIGSNCSQYPPPLPMSCESSMYGCCPDNVTTKNMEGSNCNVQPSEMGAGVQPYSTSTVFIPPPSGVMSSTSSAPSCPEPAPCPACARCPEPAFECKKVPNYERTDNERYVPQAVLTDFSSFGM